MSLTITKYNLTLNIKINLEKYNTQTKYKLPPEEIGICKEWRFENIDNKTSNFYGIWDLRKVHKSIDLYNFTEELESYLS